MDATDRFAVQAAEFRDWAQIGIARGASTGREALGQLTRLYLSGLALPPFGELDGADEEDEVSVEVPEAEWRAVVAAAGALPVSAYWRVFDPLVDPPALVAGALSDDLCDIYIDVVGGLMHYDAGRRAEALFEWSFQFQHHWGEHATSAIRALSSWLRENGSLPDG